MIRHPSFFESRQWHDQEMVHGAVLADKRCASQDDR
jgi:hypothetical protein